MSQPCGQGLYCLSLVGRVCIVPALWVIWGTSVFNAPSPLSPCYPAGYVVDEAFEGAVQAHLMPASLLLFGLDCTPTSTPSEICQMLTADQAVLLK